MRNPYINEEGIRCEPDATRWEEGFRAAIVEIRREAERQRPNIAKPYVDITLDREAERLQLILENQDAED